MNRAVIQILLIGTSMSAVVPASDAAPQQSRSTIKFGAWTFSSESDPMSDGRSARIDLDAGGKSFSFQCDAPGPNSIYPLFGSDQYLGGTGAGYGRRQIMIRFDTDRPMSPTWVYKGPIAFLPHGHDQAIQLMQRALTAQKLAVRATTYNSEFVDAVFELSGTRAAFAKIGTACQDSAVPTAADAQTSI